MLDLIELVLAQHTLTIYALFHQLFSPRLVVKVLGIVHKNLFTYLDVM